MSMVAAATINNLVRGDVFGLLGEVSLHSWWWPVWAMSSWVIVFHVVRFEEGDVEHWVYQ